MAYFDSLYAKSSSQSSSPTVNNQKGGYFGSLFTQPKSSTRGQTIQRTTQKKVIKEQPKQSNTVINALRKLGQYAMDTFPKLPEAHFADKMDFFTPIGFIAHLAQGAINTVPEAYKGQASQAKHIQQHDSTPQQVAADAAAAIQLPLLLFTGGTSSVAKQGITGTFTQIAKQGGKEFIKGLGRNVALGGAFGALGGLQSGKEIKNTSDYVKNLLANVGLGAATAGAIHSAVHVAVPIAEGVSSKAGSLFLNLKNKNNPKIEHIQLDPKIAQSMVINNDKLAKSSLGKAIVKESIQAQKDNRQIAITPNKNGKYKTANGDRVDIYSLPEYQPGKKNSMNGNQSKSYTPDEVLGKIIGSPLENTKEGKALTKYALESKARGENISIDQPQVRELVHGTNNTLETINKEGLHLSRNSSNLLGKAVYFSDSSATVIDHGANYVSIKGDNFRLKTFKTLEDQNAYVEKLGAKNLADAIRKEGKYDGFEIPNPDPKVGNTIGLVDLKKVNKHIVGKNVGRPTPLDYQDLADSVKGNRALSETASLLENNSPVEFDKLFSENDFATFKTKLAELAKKEGGEVARLNGIIQKGDVKENVYGEFKQYFNQGKENNKSTHGGTHDSSARSEGRPKGETSSKNNAPGNRQTTEGKTASKIALSIEQKAIDQRLTEGLKDLAGFDRITIDEQKTMARKVMENIDEASSIIRGDKPLPTGLNPLSLVLAAEEKIKLSGDIRLVEALANSPLVSESSRAAQIMRLAAEREPDSLVARLQELRKVKEDAIKRRTGKSVEKAVKTEIEKKIKVKKPDKYDWNSFAKSIEC